MEEAFTIHPIGVIHNTDDEVRIEIYPPYTAGLLGMEQFSHINVLYWLHLNDTPEAQKSRQSADRRFCDPFATPAESYRPVAMSHHSGH